MTDQTTVHDQLSSESERLVCSKKPRTSNILLLVEYRYTEHEDQLLVNLGNVALLRDSDCVLKNLLHIYINAMHSLKFAVVCIPELQCQN